jgi:PHP family Zn ribbon phosphoesterase
MGELDTIVEAQKARIGETLYDRAKRQERETGKTAADVIRTQMDSLGKRIIWEACSKCEKEYGDLPDDKICHQCRPAKEKQKINNTTEDDVNEIIDFKDRASGEQPPY